jgi:predicted glycoside hydrolase/deacetylase ChbG (UPF0249 family)
MVDIGLHLDLTEHNGKRLPLLMLQSYLRTLCPKQLTNLIRQQLECFMQTMGRDPDFIDGHQHVHHLPIVRAVLLNIYLDYFPNKQPYVRISTNRMIQVLGDVTAFPKAPIIALTGALALRRRLKKLKIPHNQSFAGIYPFTQAANYRWYFQRFLSGISAGGLIMCHPGLPSQAHADPLSASRFHEYRYLMSDDFLQDCDQQNVSIGHFTRTVTMP